MSSSERATLSFFASISRGFHGFTSFVPFAPLPLFIYRLGPLVFGKKKKWSLRPSTASLSASAHPHPNLMRRIGERCLTAPRRRSNAPDGRARAVDPPFPAEPACTAERPPAFRKARPCVELSDVDLREQVWTARE